MVLRVGERSVTLPFVSCIRCTFVLAILALVACHREQPRRQSGPPIVLISVDTLRADHLPAYGYKAIATPALDRLRDDSILFTNAYAHCPLTLPSHVSMLTGLLPPEHAVRNNAGYTFDTKKHTSLPSLLRERGYRSGAAVSSYILRKETGLAAMFDFYDDAIPLRGEAVSFVHQQRSGSVTVESAERWIAQQSDQPFFFFVHLYEPHTPYEPPEPYRSRYANPYDGEIAHSDQIIGAFLDRLRALGVYDRALIIFTSDHGEGLNDHGEAQHGILLYRESVHVPLLVKLPGSDRRGERVDSPVALIDILPTITGLLGIATPQTDISGRSLLSTPKSDRQIYSESYFPLINLGWSPLRSLRDARYAFIEAPRPELYDVVKDPREHQNIVAVERRTAAAMRQALDHYPSALQPIEAVDPETARNMAALGYIGSARSRNPATSDLNPRDQVRLLPRIAEAFRLADLRRYDEAISIMRELLEANPRMLDIREKLADTLAETGHVDEAIAAYQTAIQQVPELGPALSLRIAELHLRRDRLAEAEAHARAALRSDPFNAHTLLARIAAQRRDFAAAQRELTAALTAGGRQPTTLVLKAEIEAQQGALPEALRTIEEAERRAAELRIDKILRLDFVRGDVLARMNRLEEAATAYEREIERFPTNLQAYANLAVLHAMRGNGRAFDQTLNAMIKANPTARARAVAAQTAEAVGDRAGSRRWREGGARR